MDKKIFGRRLSALENRCAELLHSLESNLENKSFDEDQFSVDAVARINELQLRLELCTIRSLRFLSLADDYDMKIKESHKRILDLEAEKDLLEQKLEQAEDQVELTMLQFRQVQEEFEHFFSLARSQATLLDYNSQQFQELCSLVMKKI